MFIMSIFGQKSATMGIEELRLLNDKIYRGLDLSFTKLLQRLSAQDGGVIVSCNGRVTEVKARKFLDVYRDNKI